MTENKKKKLNKRLINCQKMCVKPKSTENQDHAKGNIF